MYVYTWQIICGELSRKEKSVQECDATMYNSIPNVWYPKMYQPYLPSQLLICCLLQDLQNMLHYRFYLLLRHNFLSNYFMPHSSSYPKTIIKVNPTGIHQANDLLATEEPLEIRLSFTDGDQRMQKSISITMRTPGNDFELAAGFLFTEGIISKAGDIQSIKHCNGLHENVVKVELKEDVPVDIGKLQRNFYTTSSCGVCGKSSLEALKTVCRQLADRKDDFCIAAEVIYSLPAALRAHQNVFDCTGGLHACGLFDAAGKLLLTREDVGRHNALDKLIGALLNQTVIKPESSLLLLSGRASFELIQKAYMAGIQWVAAVGAPSSLAVQMADEFGITLVGFLRGQSFNIYTGAQRITKRNYENSYQR